MINPLNPFARVHGDYECEVLDVAGRLQDVKNASAEQLRFVLMMPDIQSTVRLAAERRLRKLAAIDAIRGLNLKVKPAKTYKSYEA